MAVSDAHSVTEVGVAYTAMDGDPSTPAGLLAALANGVELVPGRATYFVRALDAGGQAGPADPRQRPGQADRRVRGRAGRGPAVSETGGEDLRPMAAGPGEPVASGAMEISPGLDAIPARPDAGSGEGSATAPVEPEEEVTAEQVSLSRRLRQPRTIISIIIPLVIIAAFIGINGAALAKVPGLIAGANPVLVAAAFGIFYLGFPLRGWRWKALLRGTDFIIGTKDSTVIIFLSWLVNCVVPAKLGDVYRAYLLKINSTASLSKTFGTVFIERVLDVIAIALLGIAGRLLELPRRPAAGGPGRVRDRPRRRRSC